MQTAELEGLGNLPLLAGLTDSEARLFLARGQRMVFPVGEAVARAGEPADSLFVILRGTVEVRVNQEGVAVPVAQLQTGQLLGEMAYFLGTPYRLADAVVVKEALLCKFPFTRLHELVAKNPELGEKIQRNLRFVTVERARENTTRSERAAHMRLLTPIQRRLALARCAAFEGFSAEELQSVQDVAEPLRYEALEPLIRAGDPADCLYVVVLGHLEVRIATDGGVFSIAQIGPGQCVGELPLVYNLEQRTASVFSTQPSTVLRLRYADLEQAVGKLGNGRERMLANLGRLADDRAQELARLEDSLAEGGPPQ